MQTTTVSMGPGSYVGFGVGGAAFVEACLHVILGNATADDTGVIMQGVGGALLLIITVLGRQWQATAQTQAAAQVEAAKHTATVINTPVYHTLEAATASDAAPAPVAVGQPTDPSLEVPGGSVPPSEHPPV
jgi:hypothetical protein